MTLTFDIESRVLYTTYLLIIINILTKLYENVTITFEVMARTRQKLHVFELLLLSVTLNFDIQSWVFYMTLLHIMINFSTKFYEDTTIIY